MNTLHVSIKRSVFFFNTSISWLQFSAASNRNDHKSQVQDQSEGNRIRATRFSCSVARKCRPFHPKEEQKKKERNQLEIKTGDEWLRVGNRRRRAEAILISSDGPAIEDAYFIFTSLLPPKNRPVSSQQTSSRVETS